jgi:hypothetical protein
MSLGEKRDKWECAEGWGSSNYDFTGGCNWELILWDSKNVEYFRIVFNP